MSRSSCGRAAHGPLRPRGPHCSRQRRARVRVGIEVSESQRNREMALGTRSVFKANSTHDNVKSNLHTLSELKLATTLCSSVPVEIFQPVNATAKQREKDSMTYKRTDRFLQRRLTAQPVGARWRCDRCGTQTVKASAENNRYYSADLQRSHHGRSRRDRD